MGDLGAEQTRLKSGHGQRSTLEVDKREDLESVTNREISSLCPVVMVQR